MKFWVVLSGENPELGRSEAWAAAEALQGRGSQPTHEGLHDERVEVELESRRIAAALADRIALAYRCLEPWDESIESLIAERFRREGSARQSGAVRWGSSPHGGSGDRLVRRFGTEYKAGGGAIDLDHPQRRFWLYSGADSELRVAEEVAQVDRRAFRERAMPRLPFQRPFTLPPRWARAATNLAGVRRRDRVVDPFLGTGSLLVEAAMMGARVVGVDRSAAMVRGALRNFSHLGLSPEQLLQADAAEAARGFGAETFDALLTDAPYGRASGSGGEPVDQLLQRVLLAWSSRVKSSGRIVVVAPEGRATLGAPWSLRTSVKQRVHRSLVREFRLYSQDPE